MSCHAVETYREIGLKARQASIRDWRASQRVTYPLFDAAREEKASVRKRDAYMDTFDTKEDSYAKNYMSTPVQTRDRQGHSLLEHGKSTPQA